MTEWYYSLTPGAQEGPVDAEDLALLHADGQLGPDSLVWREGMSNWTPWREVMAQVLPASAAAPPVPSQAPQEASGQELQPDYQHGATAPTAPQDDGAWRPYAVAEPSPYAPPKARVTEQIPQAVLGHRVVYAGFWKRFAAAFIDNFVVSIIGGIIGAFIGFFSAITPVSSVDGLGLYSAVNLLAQLASMVVAACYFGWMYASKYQASLGKMAIGIKVVRGNGDALTFWRGFWRYFAQIPSALILMIGYIMAAFTERKQALHDYICDTLVVDKWAYTGHPEYQQESLGVVTIVILCLAGLLMFGIIAVMIALGLALGSGLR